MTEPARDRVARPAPLHGLRVLDRSLGIAGAYTTKLLADAGASVDRIEPAEGDPLARRSTGPQSGILHGFLHASKRPRGAMANEQLAAALAHIDLVVETRGWPRPETHEPCPELDAWQAANPLACRVSISPFGCDGPWARRPATEFTLQAQAGSTATRGLPGRPLINSGGAIGEWMTGVSAAVAAMAVWHRALRTGRGDHVDVSMLESITPTCTNVQSLWGSFTGEYESEPRLEIPSIEPTRDGYVGFCVFTGQQWRDFCVLIGRPELADDPALSTMGGRIANGARVRADIQAYTSARTTDEVVAEAAALRIPVAPIANGATVVDVEHVRARGVYRRDPAHGLLAPRVPYRIDQFTDLDAEPASVSGSQAAHDPPRNRAAAAAATPTTADADGWPLADVRVLDMTAFWAGPYAGFMLACLGADVLHIESVQRPDGMRFGSVSGPGTEDWWELGPTFHAANANKRSVTLDLTRPAGLEALRHLVVASDVLIENFSPRVLEQFGCPWETLASWNPELVLIRMPAFGLDGPWRDRVGFAQTMEQISGMAWLTGYADTEPMNARGPSDPLAGAHATFGALVGLELRRRTGRGCHIEAPMVEAALNATAEQVLEHSASGSLLARDGNHHPGEGPQGVYPSVDRPAGTMGAVAIAAPGDAERLALARLLGRPVPAEPDDFDEVVGAWCATRPLHETVEALVDLGIPAAAVVGARRGDDNPQHRARGFYEAVTHPVAGTHRIAAFPARFGRQPEQRFTRPAPLLGQHTREVLHTLAGYDDAALDRLQDDAIIGTRPRHA